MLPSIIYRSPTIDIMRPNQAKRHKGRIEDAGSVKHTIVANVQPLTGNELLQESEGDRRRDRIELYSEFEFADNDVVVYAGRNYEVQRVERWNNPVTGTRYFRAEAEKIDGQH